MRNIIISALAFYLASITPPATAQLPVDFDYPAGDTLTQPATLSEPNIRAWHADGQLWVVWKTDPNNFPHTFEIYSSSSVVTNISQAELTGRLFPEECVPTAVRQQTGNNAATYIIPDGAGGQYVLAPDEGLFVETVSSSGAKYYGIVEEGETQLIQGDNFTETPVTFAYSPDEPVQAHMQLDSTLASGHRVRYYYMWADGRDEHWLGRPDFPVMANRHKNGMPSLFIVSAALDLPPNSQRSVVHWLHGGDGEARQSLPTTRQAIYIKPQDGYLVAHNDDFQRYLLGQLRFQDTNTWWFGWSKNHNPFDPGFTYPASNDTIINYTQRRILWITDWLIREMNADPERISIQGHSAGSAGTTALAKAFPNRFATASIFNNGFKGPMPGGDQGETLIGTIEQNLPTNLKDHNGRIVRAYDLFDLSTPIATVRDMPLMRSWHGKNDTRGTMSWDSSLVAQYRQADSDAWGMQLYWDEREHGVAARPAHWTHGNTPGQQTERDNAAYQEHYKVHQSFPAFYNHQLYPNNADPGDGTPGTGGSGSGDDWGTWGGYHDWDLDSIVDTETEWQVTAFLIGQSVWTVDNCPFDSLTADLAIRKPQRFLPAPGSLIYWEISNEAGVILHNGTTIVNNEGLVTLRGVTTFRDPKGVKIRFSIDSPTDVTGRPALPARLALQQNYPNPFNPTTTISYSLAQPAEVKIQIFDLLGRPIRTLVAGHKPAGDHSLIWDGQDDNGRKLSSGVYFCHMRAGSAIRTRSMVLLK